MYSRLSHSYSQKRLAQIALEFPWHEALPAEPRIPIMRIALITRNTRCAKVNKYFYTKIAGPCLQTFRAIFR